MPHNSEKNSNGKKKEPVKKPVDQPWVKPPEEILEELNVSAEQGLEDQEVEKRREEYGSNKLKKAEQKSAWQIFIDQFKSLIIALLAAAGIASFTMGEWIDGAAITVAILVNAVIGFVTELKAVRSMEALEELGRAETRVRRGGGIKKVPSEELVPGDMVVFESGDLIPADIRLVEAAKLKANESALTGESVPVDKKVEAVEAEAPLAERSSMLFKGTAITRGSGEGVVVATGMDTEVGQIATLAEEAEEESTPLEKRLDKPARKLLYIILVITVIVGAVGILTGEETFFMIKLAVALAVASVPEGLPIVATIALARGMWRMADRNALVNRLSAVETLGSTNVIFTDKTGTLTQNRMTATRIAMETGDVAIEEDGTFTRNKEEIDPREDGNVREFLETGVLCNNASYEGGGDGQEEGVGDPVEVALLAAGFKAGIKRGDLLEKFPEEREEPFDSETKMMATFHRQEQNGGYRVAVKGAPEAILEACVRVRTEEGENDFGEKEREKWRNRNQELAEEGLRMLAFATKTADSVDTAPYEELTLLGLAGLWDPPRAEIPDALSECRDAGIRVIMVTGDHALTAKNIGLAVGIARDHDAEVVESKELKDPDSISESEREHLSGVSIFARVSPKQKLDLIKLHQRNNSIVAMTGDGVNDAPALKKADIGVAMGQRGTQVARQASDIVLRDDAFSTIVAAVEMGRVIFGNIRQFVVYLLSGNVGEVLLVSVALLLNLPLPLLPLQILYLNMLSDVFPALALGLGEGDPNVMEQPPRDPKEPVMTRAHWIAVTGWSVLIAGVVLGAMWLALTWLDMDESSAVTVSFLTLAFARLWHVFNMRAHSSPVINNAVVKNPFVWGALGICVALLLIAVYVPFLASVLKLITPNMKEWALIIGASFVPLILGQPFKHIPVPAFMKAADKEKPPAEEETREEEVSRREETRGGFCGELISIISVYFLLSLGGLILHLGVHPPTQHVLFWIPAVFAGINTVIMPFLFYSRTTVFGAYIFTWITVTVGTIGMTYFSILTWGEQAVTFESVVFESTLPYIILLLAKVPLAHILLRFHFPGGLLLKEEKSLKKTQGD